MALINKRKYGRLFLIHKRLCYGLKSNKRCHADGFSGHFFRFFKLYFCFVIAIFDLVHDVEAYGIAVSRTSITEKRFPDAVSS